MNLMAHLRGKMVKEITSNNLVKPEEKYNYVRELKEKFVKEQKSVLRDYGNSFLYFHQSDLLIYFKNKTEVIAERNKKRKEMISRCSLNNTIYQLLAMRKDQREHTKKKLSEVMPPISRFTSSNI
jgi:exonuclease V gamma subunit